MKKNRIKRRSRMRYWFDRLMSKGVYAQVPVLFSLSVVFIFIISLIVFYYQLNPSHEGFWAIWWSALMRALDPGTMSGDEGQDSFLLMMLIATVGGIFLVSALIGILTTSLEDMLNELRKGRSIVVEENHTVILGWSSQIFTIIDELAIANENQCHPSVVVLAEKDKVEMEDEIKSRCNNLNRWRRRHMIMMRIACFLEKITWHEIDKKRGFWVCARANTRLVCRTGVPLDPIDLKIVNPNSAKSIIILSPEIDNPDPQIIKTILAIVNNPNRSREPYHIVAAIRDLKNVNVAQLAGGNEVQLLPADDLISRITAQTCRQSGLSIVYTDLMDFGGDEIYFEGQHVPFGETFADALSFYEKSAVFGVHFGRGREQLDPPDYLLLEPNDQLILQHDELTKFYIYGPGVSGLLFAESVNICQDSCVQGASIRVQLKLDEHKIFKSGDQLIVEVEGYRIYLQADCFTGEAYHKLPDIYDQLNFNKVHFQGDHEPQKRVVESHDTFFALTKDHKKVLVSTRNLAGKTVDQILGALNNGQVKGVLCLRGTELVNLSDDFTLDPDDDWIVNKNPLFIEAAELGNDYHNAVRLFADMSLEGIRLCNGCELIKPSDETILQATDKLIVKTPTNGVAAEQCIYLEGERWLNVPFGHAVKDFENLTITGFQHANGDSELSSSDSPFGSNMRLVINSPNSRIYIQGLSERRFADAREIYQQAQVKGVRFINGRTQIHPPMNTRLEKCDEIIAISEDDDTVKRSSKTQAEIDELIDRRLIIPTNHRQPVRKSEKTLVLGWNHRAPEIIRQLDEYVAPGSIVSVFAHIPDESLVNSLPLKNITPNCKCGDRTDSDHLNKMKIISYDHVIVLSADNQSIQQADSRTLHTLLHLRHIAAQSEHSPFILSEVRDSSNKELVDHMFSIVTEIRDGSNRQLAEVTHADDFIVSDKLVSLMLAQVSEERRLLDVFTELYRSRGSEVYLKPITDYIRIEEKTETNFHTIVKAARQHGEVAIGYRLGAYMFSIDNNYGVFLNPNKSERVTFTEKDKVIVMALDG